jgi:hypothetical protein
VFRFFNDFSSAEKGSPFNNYQSESGQFRNGKENAFGFFHFLYKKENDLIKTSLYFTSNPFGRLRVVPSGIVKMTL